ncbi:MAG: aromatic ring-hydroxylating dioxygenase subunit alpha [Acidimicrobiales bacterium]|nr:aromatic ring-hydroxylating dioxygenase subunit alpha [Acidimicrobiales bacterium]
MPVPGGAAPLPAESLEAALGPFGHSRLLPRLAYVEESVFEWEEHHFLRGGWTCVGLGEDMARVGDQRAEPVGGAGVFLVRAEDGRLRGFANACRHRGHELLPCGESRNLPMVVCPYHSWSYHLDGSLRGAPRFDVWEAFDRDDNGLVELPTEEWHGLTFVAAGGGDPAPLEAHFAGLEELVAPHEPERLRVAARHDYVVEANWKVVIENYQECYHCAMIHPELCAVSPPRSGENYRVEKAGAWVGGWMALRDEAETMSLSGKSGGTVLRGLDSRGAREVVYLVLFPNVLLSLHPDYVMTHLLTPVGPRHTRVRCSWAFSPEDLGRPGFDPSFAVDFWDLTNRQDFSACESVQRGLASEHWVPGQLGPDEDGVYQFVTMVARAYLGLPVSAGRSDTLLTTSAEEETP